MRGMVKWKPFNSLLKSGDIYNIDNTRFKISKPIISKDRIINIDYTLKEAINYNLNVEVKYWNKDNLIYINGIVDKINIYEKYILINNKRMYFKNIINIKIID